MLSRFLRHRLFRMVLESSNLRRITVNISHESHHFCRGNLTNCVLPEHRWTITHRWGGCPTRGGGYPTCFRVDYVMDLQGVDNVE